MILIMDAVAITSIHLCVFPFFSGYPVCLSDNAVMWHAEFNYHRDPQFLNIPSIYLSFSYTPSVLLFLLFVLCIYTLANSQ
jgi:hypothetical protein